MKWLLEKNDFKRRVREVLGEFERLAGGDAPPDFQGAKPANPLEHVTRRHLIDHVLMALGWNLDRMGEDMIEEARTQGAVTLFLDYLGVTPQTRVPRLIVEAKAWAKPIIAASGAGAAIQGETVANTSAGLVALALQHIKDGRSREDSPVTLEWTDWLTTLRDHVVAIYRQSGHLVGRVAISSGRWLVIFVDPETAFVKAGNVSAGSIQVFVGAELVERSSDIFDRLARVVLIDDIPPILRPSQLPAFIDAQHIMHAFRALWITRHSHGPHFNIRPQIVLSPAIVIERDDGALLTIVDEQLADSLVPYDRQRLLAHIDGVAGQSDRLIAAINAELATIVVVSSVGAFSGFTVRTSLPTGIATPGGRTAQLIKEWPPKPDEFLLVLGEGSHYLLPETNVACGFHEWSLCRDGGQAQGAHAIPARSVYPASFFFDGEDHHCAHRLVHDRRARRCHIQPFEQYLCCRACALQAFCWSGAEFAALPCGTVAPRTSAASLAEKAAIDPA